MDLFSFRFMIVPICEDSHWFMAIINRMDLVEQKMQDHIKKCIAKHSVMDTKVLKNLSGAHLENISKYPRINSVEDEEDFSTDEDDEDEDYRM